MSFMARSKKINVKQLIKDGVFYKTGIEIKKRPALISQKMALLYKHCDVSEDLVYTIDPDTKELIGENEEKALEVLKATETSVDQLIELGVLVLIGTTHIDVQKDFPSQNVSKLHQVYRYLLYFYVNKKAFHGIKSYKCALSYVIKGGGYV